MFNTHTKFDVFTIACNEDMKRNAKCKNYRFEPLFGGQRKGFIYGTLSTSISDN